MNTTTIILLLYVVPMVISWFIIRNDIKDSLDEADFIDVLLFIMPILNIISIVQFLLSKISCNNFFLLKNKDKK